MKKTVRVCYVEETESTVYDQLVRFNKIAKKAQFSNVAIKMETSIGILR